MENDIIKDLQRKILELEEKIEAAIESGKEKFSYEIHHGKAVFDKEIAALQRKKSVNLFIYILKAPLKSLLVAPVIYAMIIPAVVLDLFVSLYQIICFPIYKIAKVKRKEYIAYDRQRLHYLNSLEKFNCLYCGYVNGLLSYVGEISGRTEQYFCPIKHAKRLKHRHASYKNFLDYGDFENYHHTLVELRKALAELPKENGKDT